MFEPATPLTSPSANLEIQPTQSQVGRLIGVACIIAITLGIGLRFLGLGAQSLWFDEGYTWWLSSQPVARLIRAVRYDFSPPGYFLMLAGWMRMFGDSEWAMRSLSALLGSASIVLVALIARRVLGYGWGMVLAVTFFALSAIQVEYSQESRPYIAGSFFFAAGLYALMRRLDGGSWRWLVTFALVAAGLVYQHNVMWFFLAGLHVFWLTAPAKDGLKRRLGEIVIADSITAVAFLPWSSGLLQQVTSLQGAYFTDRPVFYDFTHTTNWLGGAAPAYLKQLAGDLGIADAHDRLVRLGSSLLIASACLIGLAYAGGRRRMVLATLLAGLAPILLAFVYSQFRRSIYVQRAFIPASVVLPIVMAGVWPLAARSQVFRRLGGVLALLLIAVSVISCWGFFHYGSKENWRTAVQWLNGHSHESAIVVFSGPEGQALYDYYTQKQGSAALAATGAPGGFYDTDPPRAMRRVLTDTDLDPLRKALDSGGYQHVYLVQAYTLWADPHQLVPAYLGKRMREELNFQSRSIRVRSFALDAPLRQ